MAKKTKVAHYNRYIQFFFIDSENPYTMDDSGNLMPNYRPFKKKWCQKKELVRANQESLESGASSAKKFVRLSMRLTHDLKEDMCFFVDGVVYDMMMIGDPDGLNRETLVTGEASVDGGRN